LKGTLDCTTTKQVCGAIAGVYECVNCQADSDCLDPNAPLCYAPVLISDSQCVQCVIDDDCRTNTDCSATCNTASHTCVPSLPSKTLNCNTSKLVCDPILGICTECLHDSNCPKNYPFCFGGVCHECSLGFRTNSDADCRTPTNCNSICQWNTTTKKNMCINTGSPLNCSSQRMACDTFSGGCMECSHNADCSNTPSTPYCSPQGNCVECLGDLQCQSNTTCSSTCFIDFTCSKGVDCTHTNATCNLGVCYAPQFAPSDCQWSQWIQQSCTCGILTLVRSVIKPALNGGKDCSISDATMTTSCNNTWCPANSEGSAGTLSISIILSMALIILAEFF